jgi:hypothetical protein
MPIFQVSPVSLSLSLSLCIYIFYFFTFLPFSIDDILFVFLNIFIQDPQIIMQSSNVAIRWLKAKSLQVSFSLLVVLWRLYTQMQVYIGYIFKLYFHAEVDERIWWNEKFRFVLPQLQFQEMPKLTVRLMKRVKFLKDCSIGETMYFYYLIIHQFTLD